MQARFSLRADAAPRLTIVEVVDGRAAAGLDQFTVLFQAVGAPGPMLRAGIHTLSHPTHGEMELYLEPVADSPNGPAYRATLCLLS
jgi:hypothetical protein